MTAARACVPLTRFRVERERERERERAAINLRPNTMNEDHMLGLFEPLPTLLYCAYNNNYHYYY